MPCKECREIEENGFIDRVVHCTDCHRSWRGATQSHCAVCHHHFGTDGLFMLHQPEDDCVDPKDIRDRKGRQAMELEDTDFGKIWTAKLHPPSS